MSNFTTIAQHWEFFEHEILDRIQAGPVQREESKKAFWVGCIAMFDLVNNAIDPDEDLSVQRLDTIHKEIEAYIKSFH